MKKIRSIDDLFKSDETGSEPRKRILVIDDQKEGYETVRAVLPSDTYIVDYVDRAEKGLDRLRSESYDALILDMVMPEKDGKYVLENIRRGNSRIPPGLPVLVRTAYIGRGVDEKDLSRYGVNDGTLRIQHKDAHPEKILNAIESLLTGERETKSEPSTEAEEKTTNAGTANVLVIGDYHPLAKNLATTLLSERNVSKIYLSTSDQQDSSRLNVLPSFSLNEYRGLVDDLKDVTEVYYFIPPPNFTGDHFKHARSLIQFSKKLPSLQMLTVISSLLAKNAQSFETGEEGFGNFEYVFGFLDEANMSLSELAFKGLSEDRGRTFSVQVLRPDLIVHGETSDELSALVFGNYTSLFQQTHFGLIGSEELLEKITDLRKLSNKHEELVELHGGFALEREGVLALKHLIQQNPPTQDLQRELRGIIKFHTRKREPSGTERVLLGRYYMGHTPLTESTLLSLFSNVVRGDSID
ncbi:DNA-binding response regulator [Candidatus Woesearchaeota archaeon]|nr:MAG: DNA-binding response regulator [Candidatus Woesearchaeota archaeon]